MMMGDMIIKKIFVQWFKIFFHKKKQREETKKKKKQQFTQKLLNKCKITIIFYNICRLFTLSF